MIFKVFLLHAPSHLNCNEYNVLFLILWSRIRCTSPQARIRGSASQHLLVTAPHGVGIFREERLQRINLAHRIKMFKRLGMNSDTDTDRHCSQYSMKKKKRWAYSTLICIFLQSMSPGRQAGQITFEAKSSMKKVFN